MTATITIRMTPQGLLIPRAALANWGAKELEAVWEKHTIVIRPKPMPADQVRQILCTAGMLYEPNWEIPPPVSQEERAHLAKRLAQGQPLSEIIIADREDRV